MKRSIVVTVMTMAALAGGIAGAGVVPADPAQDKAIHAIDPPDRGFFSRVLYFHGIPIKSSSVVSNEALYAAYDRLSLLYTNLMTKQPWVLSNQVASGCEFHIIGRNQVTTDLPEYLQDKHVPLDEYNGLTRDQRTRGMGGHMTSFGEENLLQLPNDRYRGRDICLHESSHSIMNYGCQPSIKTRFAEQRQKSLDKGLWVNSYAGSNPDEYFAELTMWYFGTHGDLTMTGVKPENGPEGLKKYDPDAYALIDDFWSGRIQVDKVESRFRPPGGGTNAATVTARGPRGGTNGFAGRTPRDSVAARALVGHLASYQVGETKLDQFYADAGMTGPAENGTNGWYVTRRDSADGQTDTNTVAGQAATYAFRIEFRDPRPRPQPAATNGTNAVAGQGNARGGGRGAGGRSRGSIADVDFKAGVLTAFKWNN